MKDAIYSEIKNVFAENNGYASTKDLVREQVHPYHIKKLEESGEIFKIKRGLYRWVHYKVNQFDEIVDVSKIVPNGVICLLSALSFYELTTYQPWKYDVAVYRDGSKIQLPDYPPIQLNFFSKVPFKEGIVEHRVDGHHIKMYDIEKTLCDIARYRNKIGLDIVKEAFKTYVLRSNKNIGKLIYYAEVTRVKSVVLRYVEVLL